MKMYRLNRQRITVFNNKKKLNKRARDVTLNYFLTVLPQRSCPFKMITDTTIYIYNIYAYTYYSLLAIRGGVATAATVRACVSRAIQKTRRARTTR